jgi:hypothetical protein
VPRTRFFLSVVASDGSLRATIQREADGVIVPEANAPCPSWVKVVGYWLQPVETVTHQPWDEVRVVVRLQSERNLDHDEAKRLIDSALAAGWELTNRETT